MQVGLAAAAALAKNSFNDGADFILLPEIGLNLKEIYKYTRKQTQ